MDYYPLSDDILRRVIDSTSLFTAYCEARAQAQAYAGGMYWKRHDNYEYLVKTLPDNRQQRLGTRGPETEATYKGFMERRAQVRARLASLKTEMVKAAKLNRALGAGRAPSLMVKVLDLIAKEGFAQNFVVIGTHAMYAYEQAAGVRVVDGALATQDVDILWDARRKAKFFVAMEHKGVSMIKLLQKADKTFQRSAGKLEAAVNDKGFEIEFLRRQPEDGDPHPLRFSKDEGDLWPVQARRASVLTSAPVFERGIIATNGQMALMRTVDPKVFVDFKRWLAAKAPDRPADKRQRDARQADIVENLINESRLQSRIEIVLSPDRSHQ